MTKPKFKVGDKCLDLQFGWANVEAVEDKVYIRFVKDNVGLSYRSDGRLTENSFAPSILTVEEAAKLGYFPEKKKVKKNLYAYFSTNNGNEYAVRFTTLEEKFGQKLTFCGRDVIRAPHLDTEIEVDLE